MTLSRINEFRFNYCNVRWDLCDYFNRFVNYLDALAQIVIYAGYIYIQREIFLNLCCVKSCVLSKKFKNLGVRKMETLL